MIKKLIIKLFRLLGYNVESNRKFLKNVFNTRFQKNVLISYVIGPFLSDAKRRGVGHTMGMECYTAAKIFQELGYNVDATQFSDKRNIKYEKYDCVYGFGYSLENAFYSDCAEKIKKIYYSTGASPFYSDKQTALKLNNFNLEKGLIIPKSARLVPGFSTLSIIMPDLNITLGNAFTANTYLEINPKLNVRTTPVFYYDCYDCDLSRKNFNEARKHFLWFGSGGLLHKGLDILIDIFSQRNDIFLHICGASKDETKFFDYYKPIIERSNNIIEHGFVDINSADFKNVMDKCAFVVHPSVSEGGAASVVTVMANGGLIPIISKSSGLDVEEFGYVFDVIDKNTVLEYINEALKLSNDVLYEKALKTKSTVRKNHTYEIYRQNLLKYIKEALGQEKI